MTLKSFKLSDIYYILVVFGYLLTLWIGGFRTGVFASVLMLGILAEFIYRCVIKDREYVKTLIFMDYAVIAYFVYAVLSVIWLVRAGYPVSVYAEELSNSVLPVFFYFIATSRTYDRNIFYKNFIAGVLIVGIAGIILYVWAPGFYIDYLFERGSISKADVPTMRVRMASVIGETSLGFLGAAGMLASSFFILNETDKEKFFNKNRMLSIASFVLCFVITILANMRSSMFVAILVIFYVNHLIFFEFRILPKKFFIAEMVVIAAAFFVLCAVKFDMVLKVYYRLISLPGAVSQRSIQWVTASNNMYSTWLGNGLGANGHKAYKIEGAHIVADGGIVKLFCELGVIGFSLFFYIVLNLCIKNSRDFKNSFTEYGLVAAMLLTSIGSNIIAFQLCTPIFWYALGVMSRNYKEKSSREAVNAL